MGAKKKEVTRPDVRRMALPRYLPVFTRSDLATRYSRSHATIGRWADDGRFGAEDVYTAEGVALGWTWSAVTLAEATCPELAECFKANQIAVVLEVGAE